MPIATHRKTSGATAVLMRRRKMSPRILSWLAKEGNRKPTAAPSTMATTIWKPRFFHNACLGLDGGVADTVEVEAVMGVSPGLKKDALLLARRTDPRAAALGLRVRRFEA